MVEGYDDKRFFEEIVRPIFEQDALLHVQFWQYAQKTKKEVANFIRSIDKTPSADYLFIHDFDSGNNSGFCIGLRKQKIKTKYGGFLKDKKIFIVKETIESWYLAGQSPDVLKKLGISKRMENTEKINKAKFDALIPKEHVVRAGFMTELLNHYQIGEARLRNTSFDYFLQKTKLT